MSTATADNDPISDLLEHTAREAAEAAKRKKWEADNRKITARLFEALDPLLKRRGPQGGRAAAAWFLAARDAVAECDDALRLCPWPEPVKGKSSGLRFVASASPSYMPLAARSAAGLLTADPAAITRYCTRLADAGRLALQRWVPDSPGIRVPAETAGASNTPGNRASAFGPSAVVLAEVVGWAQYLVRGIAFDFFHPEARPQGVKASPREVEAVRLGMGCEIPEQERRRLSRTAAAAAHTPPPPETATVDPEAGSTSARPAGRPRDPVTAERRRFVLAERAKGTRWAVIKAESEKRFGKVLMATLKGYLKPNKQDRYTA